MAKQYIVDAYTDRLFSSSHSAVRIVDECLDDEILSSIAKENNLIETAFIKRLKETPIINRFSCSFASKLAIAEDLVCESLSKIADRGRLHSELALNQSSNCR